MLARFELWQARGVVEPGPREHAEMREYGVLPRDLRNAYLSYCAERADRDRELLGIRDYAVDRASEFCEQVFDPLYSLNLVIEPIKGGDDYVFARRLLRREGVALYPGVLAYCFGGWNRVSPGIDRAQLGTALQRMRRFVAEERARGPR
jgi:hypothetical protein